MKARILSLILLVGFVSVSHGQSQRPYFVQINDKINEVYKKSNVAPNQIIPDDKFVRRAYLQIAGRIPTVEEFDSFIKSPSKTKRHELIDKLVASKDFTSHWYNYWSDIFRITENIGNNNNYGAGDIYADWIKKSITDNKRYDLFVQEILTSTGNIYDNPATGYFLRDRGMLLDNVAGTSEIFFGADISCAQCHDDPFQDWTQKEYYQLTAFFVQNQDSNGTKEEQEYVKAIRNTITKAREQYGTLVTVNKEEFLQKGLEKEKVMLPVPADLDKLTKRMLARNSEQATQVLTASIAGITIDPKKTLKLPHDYKYDDAKPNDVVEPNILFGDYEVDNPLDYKQDFARWATSPKNPFFTKNIVNRYWDFIFGRAIAYPINNIPYSVKDDMIDEGLLNLLEQIFKDMGYNNKQFIATLYKTDLFQRFPYVDRIDTKYKLQGPVLRRLSAEQLWDSLLTLSVEDPNYYNYNYSDSIKQLLDIDLATVDVEKTFNLADEIQKIRGERYKDALKFQSLLLVRASDNIANSGTTQILREFGQSEKTLIQDSARDGSVTQVISFVNGPVSQMITDKKSNILIKMEGKPSNEAIDMAFKAVLQRLPSLEERDIFKDLTNADIIWALANSHEFKFN